MHFESIFFISSQYRFARLEQPSQFNGDPCDYTDKETEDCVPNNPCRNKVRCDGFVCAVTGKDLGGKEWWCSGGFSETTTLNILLLQEFAGRKRCQELTLVQPYLCCVCSSDFK